MTPSFSGVLTAHLTCASCSGKYFLEIILEPVTSSEIVSDLLIGLEQERERFNLAPDLCRDCTRGLNSSLF